MTLRLGSHEMRVLTCRSAPTVANMSRMKRWAWWAPLVLASCLGGNELGYIEATHFGDLSHGEPERMAFDERIVDRCGDSGALTSAGQDALARTPYVQRVDGAGAVFMMKSTEASRVRLFDATPRRDQAVDTEILLDVSPPDTTSLPTERMAVGAMLGESDIQCYQVMGPDGAWTAPTGLFTAPRTRDSVVRFSSFGDLGQDTSDQRAVLEALRGVESEFVVVNGDVAYEDGTPQEIQDYFFEVYADVLDNVPFFPALGNHDARTQGGKPLLDAFELPLNGGTERFHYSYDWGPVHVAVINTESPTASQAAWLDQDLSASDAAWNIVVGHKPPYSSGSHGGDTDVLDVFSPVLVDHGVELALFGHEHNYERTIPIGGVTYVVSGGGGVGTREIEATEISAHANRVAHFVHFEATPDELTMWAIDGTGQVFDTWQATKD